MTSASCHIPPAQRPYNALPDPATVYAAEAATPGSGPGAPPEVNPDEEGTSVSKKVPRQRNGRVMLALIAAMPHTARVVAWPIVWMVVALALR